MVAKLMGDANGLATAVKPVAFTDVVWLPVNKGPVALSVVLLAGTVVPASDTLRFPLTKSIYGLLATRAVFVLVTFCSAPTAVKLFSDALLCAP